MKQDLNINTRATVTLTEIGARILNEHNVEWRPSYTIVYNEGDSYNSELWDIMNIFGHFLYNGCKIPFVDNKITIEAQ